MERIQKMAAYRKAAEWGDKIPIGIFYKSEKPDYGEKSGISQGIPLVDEAIENIDLAPALNDFA